MNFQHYYTQQSFMSDPGRYQHYFADLPDDPAFLCEWIRGLMLHFLDHENISEKRLAELNIRRVEDMFEQILHLNNEALTIPRMTENKLIGCCRDFSLLLCAVLRHKKIPARLRFGFTTFHLPNFHHDQVLLEYWHEDKQAWCFADVRMNERYIKKHQLDSQITSHDIPREWFFTAGQAWQLCRTGAKNPLQFGSGVERRYSGWNFIRNKMIQDLAALNLVEVLPWDCWGVMLQSIDDFALLDDLAALITDEKINVAEINQFFRSTEIFVPVHILPAC